MVGDPEKIEHAVKSVGWKFSKIDGDPSLGDGVKCYATMHYNERKPIDDVIREVNDLGDALEAGNIDVVRRKVELVVYDTRSCTVKPE